jgi:choline dehydrogenase-like flavoprotein
VFNGRSTTGGAVGSQFLTSAQRGRVGGLKLNVWPESWWQRHSKFEWMTGDRTKDLTTWVTGKQILEEAREAPHCQFLGFDGEVVPSEGKYIGLSDQRDRFGDPFASVHYEHTDFDRATFASGNALLERVAHLIDGEITGRAPPGRSGHHHHGGTRMSNDPKDGVVDPMGRVHGVRNLLVLGGSSFPGFSAVNPTLTMVALAIRSTEALLEELH